MSLFRTAAKCRHLMRFTPQNQGLSALLRNSPRHFSTESQLPTQKPRDGSQDAFRRAPNTGFVYGKVYNITKHTEKSDILSLLEGAKLSSDDIKVEYNRAYVPVGMMIQFPSRYAFDAAVRDIGRKGRLYRLEMVADPQWNQAPSYDGKAVLLQGLPRIATEDDLDWFLSGCTYISSQTQIFIRPAVPEPLKWAIVHFPSKTLATHAVITKNRGFCRNNQVTVQVLH